MQPTLSVGMPIYNGEKFVAQAVRSILAQTYRDLELVISDNASTDRTPEICAGFAAQDPRVRIVRNPHNVGAAANFNGVLGQGRGRYFKWACGDDWCDPTFAERCITALEQNPDAVLCFSRVNIVDESGALIQVHSDNLDLRSPDVQERFRHARAHDRLLHVLQGVIRRDVLRRIGPMRPFYSSDLTMMSELALWGQFIELPEPLLYRRLHSHAASAITDREERLRFLDPGQRRSGHLVRWQTCLQHLRAVSHCPQPLAVRAGLCGSVLRAAYWSRRELFNEAIGALTRPRTKTIADS
jgi:glycosyltransferase involved in cell wall biosynthesis